MAFANTYPIIIFNSSGSDTQASGAGPTTAITGNSAVLTNNSATVTMTTDNPDLSGVSTDGSAAFFINDSTPGNRNFYSIVGVNNGAKTITVSPIVGATGGFTGSWAIGGKRATLQSSTSNKLFSNNSTTGDAVSGWTIEMDSGYTETFPSNTGLIIRGANTSTSGPITFRGSLTASVIPVLTFNMNGSVSANIGAIDFRGANFWKIENFAIKNSNASPASHYAITGINGTTNHIKFKNISVGSSATGSTGYFWGGIRLSSASSQGQGFILDGCSFYGRYAGITGTSIGIASNSASSDCIIKNCFVGKFNTGISYTGTINSNILSNCIISGNNIGVTWATTQGSLNDTSLIYSWICRNNTIHNNAREGILLSVDASSIKARIIGMQIVNNIITTNGATGISTAGSVGLTSDALRAAYVVVDSNNMGTGSDANAGGMYSSQVSDIATNTIQVLNYFTNVGVSGSTGNYSPNNTTLFNIADPSFSIGGTAQTTSPTYVVVGAVEPPREYSYSG